MTPASSMVLDLHEYAIHSQIATLERGLTNLARVLSPMESLATAPKPGYTISESVAGYEYCDTAYHIPDVEIFTLPPDPQEPEYVVDYFLTGSILT